MTKEFKDLETAEAEEYGNKEFNLSDKIVKDGLIYSENLWIGDIKEAVRLLKEVINKLKIIAETSYGEDDGTDEIKLIKSNIDRKEVLEEIDKIFGKKLI